MTDDRIAMLLLLAGKCLQGTTWEIAEQINFLCYEFLLSQHWTFRTGGVNGLLPSSTGIDNYLSCRPPKSVQTDVCLKLCSQHYIASKWEKKKQSVPLPYPHYQNLRFNHFRSLRFFWFSSKTCVIYICWNDKITVTELFYRNARCFPGGKLKLNFYVSSQSDDDHRVFSFSFPCRNVLNG